MNYYVLSCDVNDECVNMVVNEKEDLKFLENTEKDINGNLLYEKVWKTFKLEKFSGNKLNDCVKVWITNEILYVSKKSLYIFRELIKINKLEILPLKVENEIYFGINVLELIECAEGDFSLYPFNITLKKEKIPDNKNIFRIKSINSPSLFIVVSEKIKREIEDLDLNGFKF